MSALCSRPRRRRRRHRRLIQARPAAAAAVHLDEGVALAAAAATDVGVYISVCLCEFLYVWAGAAFVGQLGGTFDQYLQHFKLIPAILWLRPFCGYGHWLLLPIKLHYGCRQSLWWLFLSLLLFLCHVISVISLSVSVVCFLITLHFDAC